MLISSKSKGKILTPRRTLMTSRRSFLKGAALAGAGTLAAGATTLATINDGVKAAGKPIMLGGIVPLSGGDATSGAEAKRGHEMACEEINAMGGILGTPVEPVFADSKDRSADEVTAAANLLIDRHGVHAVINGHNIGSNNAEYDIFADASVMYIHTNTLRQHDEWLEKDPQKYGTIFMSDPAEYWYGPGWIKMISWLRDTGQWKPQNNVIALVSGSLPYSTVISNAAAGVAKDFGWELAWGGVETVATPTTEWGPVLAKLREANPAAIQNSHFYAGDIAQFMIQFNQNPINALIYFPWGPLLSAFTEIGKENSVGVMSSTVIGVLQDEVGTDFRKRYKEKFGPTASEIGASVTYPNVHHFAIAAAVAGGTSEPGNAEQAKKVAAQLKRITYRGVSGSICYHPVWQSAMPYPDFISDPSRGMPHLFYQIKDWEKQDRILISPAPYNTGKFFTPPWFKG